MRPLLIPASATLAVALPLALGACERAPAPRATSATPAEAARIRPDAPRTAPPDDDLAALGYVDFAEPAHDESGVVLRDEARSAPGYDLVVAIPFATGILIDARGRELRRWSDAEAARWLRCELLADGDLLVLGVLAERPDVGLPKAYVARLAWNGDVRWRRPLPAHHDARETPDGSLVVLTLERRDLPHNANWPAVYDNRVLRLTALGAPIGSRSLTDVLGLEYDLTDLSVEATLEALPADDAGALADVLAEVEAWRSAEDAASPAAAERRDARPAPMSWATRASDRPVDLIHSNAVRWLPPEGRAALFGADVLVTMRHLDQVAAFDWGSGALRWRWGTGVLEGPHEATLLENGRVLVFDNGIRGRGYTRVLEVAPDGDSGARITWEWAADEPTDFYCRTRGGAQGLPNGNVLVADSEHGAAFEVTREGAVVWRYRSAEHDDAGRRGAIRIRRYPPAFVEPLLERR